jgi:hypothetical protein
MVAGALLGLLRLTLAGVGNGRRLSRRHVLIDDDLPASTG